MSATVSRLLVLAPLLVGAEPALGAPPARVTLKPGAGLRLSGDELSYRPGPCTGPATDPGKDGTSRRAEGSGKAARGAERSDQGQGSCLDLRGRVAIELGPLRLQGSKLSVELDGQGRAQRLEATAVELRSGDAAGRAGHATFQVGGHTLELSGAASIRIGKLNLELAGERIDLDLDSGGLRVRGARARLQLPEKTGGTHARR